MSIAPLVIGQLPPPDTASCHISAQWAIHNGLWPVLISAIDDKTSSSPGKKPIGLAWGKERHDLRWFSASFKRHPKANVGLLLGPDGGIIDIDVDEPEKAEPVLERMFEGEAPPTLGWKNLGKKRHLIFLYDPRLEKYTGKTGIIKGGPHYPGLEIRIGRADKQIQTVAPPSLLPNGQRRTWNGNPTILALPESFFADPEEYGANEKPRKAAPAGYPGPRPSHGNAADVVERASRYLATMDAAIDGQDGSGKCFRAACKMVEFDLDYDTCLRLLMTEYNPRCQGPWSEAEMRHKLDDAFEEAERGALLKTERNGHHGPAGTEIPIEFDEHAGGNGDGRHAGNGVAQDEPSANPKGPPKALEAPDDPHRLARNIREPFVDADGNPTLVYYRGGFYVWDGTRYRLDPIFVTKTVVDESKAEIDRQNIAAIAAYTGDGKLPTANKVTTGLVKNVVQALAAMCCIDREGDAPFWINRQDDDPDPRDVISARNGLIDISGTDPVLMGHTPRFFSTHALGYDYDPKAPEPKKWLDFLRDQWPDDNESIYTLHEVLGDMLSPTEGIHALHLWIGPPRSGRGTMREVASDLVGRWNVTATSPVSLSSSFGLESLLDKKLAVMGDARTGDSHDAAVMMDRLLRITGGDPVEVNRKGRPILPDVRMNLRVLVISNEMPNFRDASGAIVSRYVVLATTKTIPKEERNPRLAAELKAELPGILNEAIKSLKTLRLRKHFLQPKSAEHLIDDAGDIASPVKVFVEERKCALGADQSVPTALLFERWKDWAIANGYQVGNIGTFGKNLKAAYPNIRKTRPRDGDKQVCTYEGIGPALPF